MNEYGIPYQRKSKKDMKRKRRNRVYKRGGTFRAMNIKKSGDESSGDEEKRE